ncbi:MAG: hypothetical protein EBU90_26980 [Proteobacteria bacterium]|nr:hypothetical protein [Pseudomonadota bacterium]
MQITLEPARTVELNEPITVLAVRDLFEQKRIIARIKDLPRGLVLWSGDDEYTAAGNWTNESATERAIEQLALDPIPFE